MMQTPKARINSAETPQRKSPATPRNGRKLKGDSDSLSSSPASKTPRNRSPKLVERKKPASPVSEKKRPLKLSELEYQLAQLQEDLKKAKDQLNSSESSRKLAQHEADEAKKKLLTVSKNFEDSQQQLLELSTSEDARVHELRKISQDRDRAWQSELEAVQKQHLMDSAALGSAMNEIQRLKVAETKHAESARAEIEDLRVKFAETLSMVGILKTELADCKESEAQANATAEMLRTDGVKSTEAYNSLALELQQSKARVKSLEGLVSKLREDLVSQKPRDGELTLENRESKEMEKLKDELNFAKQEIAQLRSALDESELRYQEEYIQTTLQIRSAYEHVELTKSKSCKREVELQKAKAQIEELKATLMDKETELQTISDENEGLNRKIEKILPNEQVELTKSESCNIEVELEKAKAKIEELKATLMDKESELQSISGKNEGLNRKTEKIQSEHLEKAKNMENLLLDKETELLAIREKNEELKREVENQEIEKIKTNDNVIALSEMTKLAEQEALVKLGIVTEEAEKSSRRVAHVIEQLDAAQSTNSELEAELRRLKVQADQWRKAAEAATAILSTDNNYGKYMDLDKSLSGHMGSLFSEDLDDDDDSSKKRNGNMLKKFGLLWKKGQK